MNSSPKSGTSSYAYSEPSLGASAAADAPAALYSGGTANLPERDVQHTWFELTRGQAWRSLALVPADEQVDPLALGMELACMAALDPRQRVLLINASPRPCDLLAYGQRSLGGTPLPAGSSISKPHIIPAPQGKYWLLDCPNCGIDEATAGMLEIPGQIEHMRTGASPYSLLLVVTGALLTRPAMVSAARAVDNVALCVTLAQTTFADAKRCLALVGAERVLGSIALRPHT